MKLTQSTGWDDSTTPGEVTGASQCDLMHTLIPPIPAAGGVVEDAFVEKEQEPREQGREEEEEEEQAERSCWFKGPPLPQEEQQEEAEQGRAVFAVVCGEEAGEHRERRPRLQLSLEGREGLPPCEA